MRKILLGLVRFLQRFTSINRCFNDFKLHLSKIFLIPDEFLICSSFLANPGETETFKRIYNQKLSTKSGPCFPVGKKLNGNRP